MVGDRWFSGLYVKATYTGFIDSHEFCPCVVSCPRDDFLIHFFQENGHVWGRPK
jgi:hypothetical protein